MSVHVMSLVWKVTLPAVQKVILLKLADNAGDEGEHVYPAISTIMRECGVGRRAVMYTLRDFETAGILVRIGARKDRNGVIEYRIDLEKLGTLLGAPSAPRAPDALPPVHDVHHPRAPRAPKPSLNHQLEPSGECIARTRDDCLQAVEAWNAMAAECGLAKVGKLNDPRRRKLNTCLKANGLDGWKAVLAKVRDSPFLKGETRHGKWRASFDWVLNEGNFTKIGEDTYDDTGTGKQQHHGRSARVSATERSDDIRRGIAEGALALGYVPAGGQRSGGG